MSRVDEGFGDANQIFEPDWLEVHVRTEIVKLVQDRVVEEVVEIGRASCRERV